jgi:tetratricopeptide (TPR) repeat protein
VEILQALSAAFPADPYLSSYLGLRYYRNLQRFDDAVVQFREALARDATFVQAYHWLGRIALDRDDLATAKAMFERYVALAPEEPRPHDSLGLLYVREGRLGDAVRAFERALARDPRFDESRDNLALAREALADVEDRRSADTSAGGA